MYFHESTTRPTKQLLPGVLARTFWGEKMLLSLVDLHASCGDPTAQPSA